MEKPKIAGKQPKAIQVNAGQTYYWCACGQSKNQPFCDGSHKVTGFSPIAWTAESTKEVWFCMCKHSKNPPFCDGTHKTI